MVCCRCQIIMVTFALENKHTVFCIVCSIYCILSTSVLKVEYQYALWYFICVYIFLFHLFTCLNTVDWSNNYIIRLRLVLIQQDILHYFKCFLHLKLFFKCTIQCSCGSVVEHCVSSTKVVGSNPREHILIKNV